VFVCKASTDKEKKKKRKKERKRERERERERRGIRREKRFSMGCLFFFVEEFFFSLTK
jgi:hypothetical protein